MRPLYSRRFLVLTLLAATAFCADNTIGQWKLNTEKSKYTPAPMPVKSLLVTREAADGGVKVTVTGEQADGTAINATYTAKYGAKEVSVSGNSPYDSVAIKQDNANTITETRKKTGGPYQSTARVVVSKDGKTMTATNKGTNGSGKQFTAVFVFDKQ